MPHLEKQLRYDAKLRIILRKRAPFGEIFYLQGNSAKFPDPKTKLSEITAGNPSAAQVGRKQEGGFYGEE